jgi:hypothetical protein
MVGRSRPYSPYTFFAGHKPAIRSTEEILAPERGARLVNCGVTAVSESETWVTAAEWLQGKAP